LERRIEAVAVLASHRFVDLAPLARRLRQAGGDAAAIVGFQGGSEILDGVATQNAAETLAGDFVMGRLRDRFDVCDRRISEQAVRHANLQ